MEVEATLVREHDVIDAQSEFTLWKRLFDDEYRSRTMIGIGVMFFQRETPIYFFFAYANILSMSIEWSGINALLYYGPTLMRNLGLTGDTVMLVSSGFVNIVQFLAVVPAILYIDSLGMSRR